jgi:hypothetical protein
MAPRPSITSDYISIILRAIERTQNDPAHLRSLVYDIARLSLGKHVLTNYQRLGSAGLQRHLQDLESAIDQIENHAHESRELTGGGTRAQLINGPDTPSEQTALSRRDSSRDLTLDEDWWKNTSIATRQTPIEIYEGDGTLTEILQPTEIWEPRFGRETKRRSANSSWNVQLALAALIGVGIYAVTFIQSNYFRDLKYLVSVDPRSGLPAQATPSNEKRPSANSTPGTINSTVGGVAIDFPLPSVYGVYIVSAGKLNELEPLSMKVPDSRVAISAIISSPSRVTLPSGTVSFVIFRRDLVSSAPMQVFVRIVAEVTKEMKFTGVGPPTTAKINDEWAIRSKSYEYKVAPVDNNPEMIVLHPSDSQLALSPGRYALVLAGHGYDFTIAGQMTETAQCLERTNAVGGLIYSECRTLP